jgi:hypothetical protein
MDTFTFCMANVEVTRGALGLGGESPGVTNSSSISKMNVRKNLNLCNEIRATY